MRSRSKLSCQDHASSTPSGLPLERASAIFLSNSGACIRLDESHAEGDSDDDEIEYLDVGWGGGAGEGSERCSSRMA